MQIKNTIEKFLKDERGSFGVKEIAITVAVIVVIGFAITGIQSNMPSWITQIWNLFIQQIQGLIS